MATAAEINRQLFALEAEKERRRKEARLEALQREKRLRSLDVLPPEADLEAHAAYGRSIVRGVSDMATGILTAPSDIVSVLATELNEPQLKESAEAFSDKIRDAMPELPPEVPGEMLVSKLVQYGLPATTAYNLIGRVAAGSPTAIRTTAQILSGGFADFLAASPDDKSVLETFKVQEPSKTELQRRARIGVEGAAAPIVALPIVSGAVAAVRGGQKIGQVVKAGIKPQAHVERTMAKELQKRADDITQTIKNIEKSQELAVEGYRPTTGTASGTPGLVQLEKGISTGKETAAEMVNRQTENLAAVRQQVESVIGSETRTERAAQAESARFVGQKAQEPLVEMEKTLALTENELTRSKEETVNVIDEFTQQRGWQSRSSEVLDDTIREELNIITREKNAKFAAIDPNNSVVVDKELAKETLRDVMKKKSALDTTPKKVRDYLGDTHNALKRILFPSKNKKELYLTYGALQDLRPDISAAITKARAANEGGVVRRLTKIADMMDNYTEIVAKSGDAEAAKRAADALDFYKNTYIPRFKTSTGDAFRKSIRSGKPWPGTTVGKKFLSPASGARESAQNLKAILKTSINKEAAEQAIRDYIISDVADMMIHTRGDKTSLVRLDKYLNQQQVRDVLAEFPSIKTELDKFRNAVARGVEEQSTFGEMVQMGRQYVTKTRKELQKNAARFFVDNEPMRAMANVLGGADPQKGMQQIIAYAKQDPTGDAMLGLRAALGDYVDGMIGSVRAGRMETRQAGLSRLLENPRTRAAISQLYSPAEMATLDRVLEQIRVMDRINMQVPAGSPTAKLQQTMNEARVVIASMYGIVKGRGIFQISRWLQKALSPFDPDVLAERLLTDAMLDPNLAKTLLMKETPKTLPIIRQRLWTYMLNNIPMEVQEEQ